MSLVSQLGSFAASLPPAKPDGPTQGRLQHIFLPAFPRRALESFAWHWLNLRGGSVFRQGGTDEECIDDLFAKIDAADRWNELLLAACVANPREDLRGECASALGIQNVELQKLIRRWVLSAALAKCPENQPIAAAEGHDARSVAMQTAANAFGDDQQAAMAMEVWRPGDNSAEHEVLAREFELRKLRSETPKDQRRFRRNVGFTALLAVLLCGWSALLFGVTTTFCVISGILGAPLLRTVVGAFFKDNSLLDIDFRRRMGTVAGDLFYSSRTTTVVASCIGAFLLVSLFVSALEVRSLPVPEKVRFLAESNENKTTESGEALAVGSPRPQFILPCSSTRTAKLPGFERAPLILRPWKRTVLTEADFRPLPYILLVPPPAINFPNKGEPTHWKLEITCGSKTTELEYHGHPIWLGGDTDFEPKQPGECAEPPAEWPPERHIPLPRGTPLTIRLYNPHLGTYHDKVDIPPLEPISRDTAAICVQLPDP